MGVGVGVHMTVGMGLGMRFGWSHREVLYYNITDVYVAASTWAAGGVADAMNDDPGRIRSIEIHVSVWVRQDAAKAAPVGGAPALWIVGRKIDNRF